MQTTLDLGDSGTRAWRFGHLGLDGGCGPRGEALSEARTDPRGVRATQVDRLYRRLSRLREANEHLVVAAVRAQTLVEEAETASHLKDEFLAAVAHEIRTPLSAVVGWARLLDSKKLAPEKTEQAVAAIGRNVWALAHMVDDLLDMSRILRGGIRLVLAPVDLTTVAQAALDTVRPLAAAKHVHVTFAAASARAISGDAERLQQVMWNLLSNAIKFTPEGGRVGVVIEYANDHVEIRVADTGNGISPTLLPQVFERFRQSEDATTQRHTGLGLGLAIVRQLVELHGGTVQAASPGVGQGATFTVRLPITSGASRGCGLVPDAALEAAG